MAIAEDKLITWIERTKHVAQNVEKPGDLSTIEVLKALEDAIPHLQEDRPIFADLELQQLFDAAERVGLEAKSEAEKGREKLRIASVQITDLAATTLEKYQPLP